MINFDMYKSGFAFRAWVNGANNKRDALWCVTELRNKYGNEKTYNFLKAYCIGKVERLEITTKAVNGDWLSTLSRNLEIQRIGGDVVKAGFVW